MEKKLLWLTGEKNPYTGKEEGAYFPADETYEAVNVYDYPIRVWVDVPGIKAKELAIPSPIFFENEEYNRVADMGIDAAERFLDALVGVEGIGHSDEFYAPVADILAFAYDENEFSSLNDWLTVKCYDYTCNANLKTIVLDTDNTYNYNEEIVIEVKDTYSLDIWDGSNHYYPRKSTGNHAILEKVLADGEPALLWHEWSQWSGDELDTGYLLTKEEALEALKDHPEIDEIREWLSK